MAIRSPPVDHAAMHGNGDAHDMVNEFRRAGMAHGIDAALRESEVDGFSEIQRSGRGVAEI